MNSKNLIPGVLILAAGKGTRLRQLTSDINKALLPVDNVAIISKIIKSFPKDSKFVVTLGFKGDLIRQYCEIAYPSYDFTFVEVDDIDSLESGPGYSALKAKKYLQRPFYITTADCITVDKIPALDSNWLGLYPTTQPELYSTAKLEGNEVIAFLNKSENGYDQAWIGVASILDYKVFWQELENNIESGEIVSAFSNPLAYETFYGKSLKWFDTGNLDDLENARLYFKNKPLSIKKTTAEYVYNDNGKLIKIIPDSKDLKDLYSRAAVLRDYIPSNVGITENFLYYDWEPGSTLYSLDNFQLYLKFIKQYFKSIKILKGSKEDSKEFYFNKTYSRISKFLTSFSDKYFTEQYTINGRKYNSAKDIIESIDFDRIYSSEYTSNFHGDLQFDNIVYNGKDFKYIDWRRNFGSSTTYGDVYYDLSKLYGGVRIPYNLVKDDSNIKISESGNTVDYSYKTLSTLTSVKSEFEHLITANGYDLDRVKLITGIIYLNMAPMHFGKLSKMLWFEAITVLHTYSDNFLKN